ncbi:DUF4364 family protein [Caproiciproducens sp. NJN-50]|uniref:DUF4364 family protein n=1 Tax=Acutalibacteraceae TaxID=3082771 RepID=UPI000FFE1522|nr:MULTISPECIES: DUF4364 family protein [Acutalibacteraceae]QAT49389.1 DUF4364 family protein [Caproiciproducens sp. NJN-50]
MAFDAFSAGIDPGGLRTKNEIRILICYLLDSVGVPLAKDDMIEMIQNNGLANYFELADAIAEMSEKGILIPDRDSPDTFSLSDSGKMIAKQLDTALPPSVRDKAVGAAIRLLAEARRERENRVEFVKLDKGYHVICHISGGDMDLMSITLYVPDLYQANMVKENFHRSPEAVYRMLLALVTGRNDMAAGFLPKES